MKMLEINELVMIRKMLGVSGESIAKEMNSTRQTISNIENGRAQNNMAIKFYKITVFEMIKKYDSNKKEEVRKSLVEIINTLEFL